MDASLGRTLDHHEFMVGLDAFRARRCSIDFSVLKAGMHLLRAGRNVVTVLMLVQGLHKLVWCLSDLLCPLPWSLSVGYIMDWSRPGLPSFLHWYIHGSSH